MRHPSPAARLILDQAQSILSNQEDESVKLYRLWKTLITVQAGTLASVLKRKLGNTVFAGPFKGMKLPDAALNGSYAPVLIGSYEHELHNEIEQIIAHPYTIILNIGCSFGYYAVGLARRMTNAKVYAYDIDEKARNICQQTIALNGMEGRVTLGEEFRGEDYASFANQDTLVVMDVEGAEVALLDPHKYPALRSMDVLVESHDLFNPEISKLIKERFADSHDIKFIINRQTIPDLSELLGPTEYIDPIDNMLLGWEDRDGPTPWLIMKRKR